MLDELACQLAAAVLAIRRVRDQIADVQGCFGAREEIITGAERLDSLAAQSCHEPAATAAWVPRTLDAGEPHEQRDDRPSDRLVGLVRLAFISRYALTHWKLDCCRLIHFSMKAAPS